MTRKILCAACFFFLPFAVVAEDSTTQRANGKQSRESLREPVFRVSKARVEPKTPDAPVAKVDLKVSNPGEHPLDPAIRFAKDSLNRLHATIDDYSCTIVKQERINGELYPQEYMYAEIRNRKVEGQQVITPFSVYLYFLRPEKIKGREVIYVEGWNEGNLVAHEANFLKIAGKVSLRPDSAMAMRGNRYPITEIGIENLIAKLIEKAERDRQYDECTVQVKEGVKINGQGCTLLEVVHPVHRPHFDFHIARVYIDDALQLPVRYEAWVWPTVAGGQPELLECYTYLNLKTNLKLEDKNFQPDRFKL